MLLSIIKYLTFWFFLIILMDVGIWIRARVFEDFSIKTTKLIIILLDFVVIIGVVYYLLK